MKTKLIVFDIDGTLVDSNKEVLASTREGLRRLKSAGHVLAIATGRNVELAQEVFEDVGISTYIVSNGAAAFIDNKLVHSTPLDKSEISKLLELTGQYDIDVVFQSLYKMRGHKSDNHPYQIAAMESFGSVAPPSDETFHLNEDVYQGLIFHDSKMDEVIHPHFNSFDFVRWHPYGVDVIPKGNSKAKTIKVLAEKLGIPMTETVAFGDGENDREMIETVGLGIVMENGRDSTKSVANFVTKSCDENGIFYALEKFDLI